MRNKMSLAILFVTLTCTSLAVADDTITVLHTFMGGAGSGDPAFQLARDSAGNLYGTTNTGGNLHGCSGQGCGVVYRLSPNATGWTYTILYQFPGYKGGTEPSQLVVDSAGNLYGELTSQGPTGNGRVYELSPRASGPWAFQVVHDFAADSDGSLPLGGLAMDSAGNLYGATAYSNSENCDGRGCGTVFELSPAAGGWTETILRSFGGNAGTANGLHPSSKVTFDAAGNLYGVTSEGGDTATCLDGCGVIYQLKPGAGSWTFNLVHALTVSEGFLPEAGLAIDAIGNLFGTTAAGGTNNAGTVFVLSPFGAGAWILHVAYQFPGGAGGGTTYSPVTVDASGNIFVPALEGAKNWGEIFELSPAGSLGWTYTMLHSFNGWGDGGYPNGLILDASGNLYGVSNYGAKAGCTNNSGCGIVFELSAPVARR